MNIPLSPHDAQFISCLGVVLAGGKSSRMGKNKASLIRGDQDMLSYGKNILKQAGCQHTVVSGSTSYGVAEGVADIVENIGPLGGIYSIIQHYQPKAILVLPVDLPLITADDLQQLKLAGELSLKACFFQQHFLPLYLPVNGYVDTFFQQHAHFFTQSNTSTHADKSLKGPSVKKLLTQVPHKALTPKIEQHLFNTNTPEQWQQAKNIWSKK